MTREGEGRNGTYRERGERAKREGEVKGGGGWQKELERVWER